MSDEYSISTSKAFNKNPTALAHPNSKQHHARYVPFSNEDKLHLWEVYNTLGMQWARISVDHFNLIQP
jgi:hypothetical protein